MSQPDRAAIAAAARRTSDDIGRSINPANPIEAEVKVQIGASWLAFAHFLETTTDPEGT